MPLETLLKLLSAAKFPLAATFLGIVLSLGGGNTLLKNTGSSVALASFGCAAATATRKNDALAKIRQLQQRHEAETTALQKSIDGALADVATARQAAQKQAFLVEQSKGVIAQLQANIKAVADERDRVRGEVLGMGEQVNAAAALGTCHNDRSEQSGELESLQLERMQLIYELYETAVTEANLSSAITSMESQFQNDSAYQLTQKKKAKSELTKARANFHSELAEANGRIEDLEVALAEKTQLATQMLTELEGDANGSFTHFSGKASAQAEVINGLKAQIDELRKTNKSLIHRRFDTVGTDNTIGNRLIDFLAKHDSIYGAFHHEREGHNGRLKVWLQMIDAPLSRAQNALEDMEAELKLYAKPAVKVDRGMHLFTLATEQEYKAIETLSTNLHRLAVTLEKANHIRLVGPTDSGKSTFLDNLIWLGRTVWQSAKFELLDPKAPFTEWSGGLVPDAKNLECVDAIEGISQKLLSRFNQANKIAEQYGNESKEFKSFVDNLPFPSIRIR